MNFYSCNAQHDKKTSRHLKKSAAPYFAVKFRGPPTGVTYTTPFVRVLPYLTELVGIVKLAMYGRPGKWRGIGLGMVRRAHSPLVYRTSG